RTNAVAGTGPERWIVQNDLRREPNRRPTQRSRCVTICNSGGEILNRLVGFSIRSQQSNEFKTILFVRRRRNQQLPAVVHGRVVSTELPCHLSCQSRRCYAIELNVLTQ